MSVQVCCDRCGEPKPTYLRLPWTWHTVKVGGYINRDLCPRCATEHERFMDGEAINTSYTEERDTE